jgi:UDP-N-acetylglucosamine 4,6-dehydratase (inverting)
MKLNSKIFYNKSILVTGGTGSFGQSFVKMTLQKFHPKKIIVFSRDEMKQFYMSQKYLHEKKINFVLGDVRDKDSLLKVLDDVDVVVHAAATKIVPSSEYNPFECVKTNIFGAMNLIEACLLKKVKKVIALSTDKACNPINFYGATKLCSDKLFIAANSYSKDSNIKFSVVRYGNVINSRGSIIPFLIEQERSNSNFTITDVDMTRFFTSLPEAVKLVWFAFSDMNGGEIYVKKNPSAKIIDFAKIINKKRKINFIGIRPGEKMHETLISKEDSKFTYDYNNYYKILPSIYSWNLDKKKIKKGKKVANYFEYSSDNNRQWLSINDMKNIINSLKINNETF